jgi:CTP-dependent riboflavin kinase
MSKKILFGLIAVAFNNVFAQKQSSVVPTYTTYNDDILEIIEQIPIEDFDFTDVYPQP